MPAPPDTDEGRSPEERPAYAVARAAGILNVSPVIIERIVGTTIGIQGAAAGT